MIFVKTPNQIKQIEYVNKLGAEFLKICYDNIKHGLILSELEELARKFCEKHKVRPSFYKYRGFPHLLCTCLNEEIVHSFPDDRIVKNGDIVSVDFGIEKDGYFSDAAFTKCVGNVASNTKKLVKVTEECLYKGIEKAVPGNRIYDISEAIYNHAVRNEFDVIRKFVGHGVGIALHEAPAIPNYIAKAVNWKLHPGMVIAIEPMLVCGSYDIDIQSNKWTAVTVDRKMAAHFEHSVAILEGGPKILSTLLEE